MQQDPRSRKEQSVRGLLTVCVRGTFKHCSLRIWLAVHMSEMKRDYGQHEYACSFSKMVNMQNMS